MTAINIQFTWKTTGINSLMVPLHGTVISALYRFRAVQWFLALLQIENYFSCKVGCFKKLCGGARKYYKLLLKLVPKMEFVLKMKSSELEQAVKTLNILNPFGGISPLLVWLKVQLLLQLVKTWIIFFTLSSWSFSCEDALVISQNKWVHWQGMCTKPNPTHRWFHCRQDDNTFLWNLSVSWHRWC